MTSHRLAEGGSGIDRASPLGFTFAGRRYGGFEGDTLASALLGNGVHLVARSFKYHRPRGVMSAGPEEANALVTLGEGGRAEPNAKATMVPLYHGLVAQPQNAKPSLERDRMAIVGRLGPLFSAGFYYKTFIGGPRGTWTKLFEPIIRRAAGMGYAPKEPDLDRYEAMHGFCDVLVVGAGPAGLMAARVAAQAGCRVILADERERLGGALNWDRDQIDGVPAPSFARRLAAEVTELGATLLPRTTVYGHYDGTFGAVQRVTDHLADPGGLPRQRHWLIRPRQVILATGAIERPIVFPGNDLPGVMLADSARAYANQYGVAPGESVHLVTNNDGALKVARDLLAAGIEVASIAHAAGELSDAIHRFAGAHHIEVSAHRFVGAVGKDRVRGTMVEGKGRTLPGDSVLVSGGWNCNLGLAAQAGAKPIWDEQRLTFRPGALPSDWQAVGAMDAEFTTGGCLRAGRDAAVHAVRELGRTPPSLSLPQVDGDDFTAANITPLFHVPGKGKAFVDLQHDVTAADLTLARDEGFAAVEHLKRYTTLGMATDQGKTSNVNGLAIMAELTGRSIPQVGTTRLRPPASPVPLGALAGESVGAAVRPVRRTPMQDWHEVNGGAMVSVGAYLRPRAYLGKGETVGTAYKREAAAVRAGVGLVDVSTLGKIEVAGPDAPDFLDRVYANGFAKLPVGKARYGVMLRDDGVVLDDGTTWRLAETRYLMTTTTANAARVLAHLETLLAVAWPELKVHVTSVSEQYAAMALAGPKSRATLAAAVQDLDVSGEAFPFMAVRRGTCCGVPLLIARLSFSGELAYEVYCGAHYGLGVWEALLEAGAPHGIVAYGTEAMGTLRIEKGHVAGAELDGRTTMHDLGLAKMASSKKAFVGQVTMQREALTAASRPRVVGLKSLTGRPIRAGAHLVAKSGSEGHVTSTTFSPTLNAEVALALLAGGDARHGERLTAAFPLKGEAVEVEVVAPVFVDPEGTRLNG